MSRMLMSRKDEVLTYTTMAAGLGVMIATSIYWAYDLHAWLAYLCGAVAAIFAISGAVIYTQQRIRR